MVCVNLLLQWIDLGRLRNVGTFVEGRLACNAFVLPPICLFAIHHHIGSNLIRFTAVSCAQAIDQSLRAHNQTNLVYFAATIGPCRPNRQGNLIPLYSAQLWNFWMKL